jgi:hypothetical protein
MNDATMNPFMVCFGSSFLTGALIGLASMWHWGWFAG